MLQVQNNHVGSSVRTILRLTRNLSSAGPNYHGSGHPSAGILRVINNYNNGSIRFYVQGDQMTILNDGNVGIGKVPGNKLDINLGARDLGIVDAGWDGTSGEDWIKVDIGGRERYIRAYSGS